MGKGSGKGGDTGKGGGAGNGENAGKGARKGSTTSSEKFQCQYHIGVQQGQGGFDVKRRVLGQNGANMKWILRHKRSDSDLLKLRLRGRGSGFKEGPRKIESRDELMLCVSCNQDKAQYEDVKKDIEQILNGIYEEY